MQLIPVFPFILPSENNVPRVWVVFNRPRKRDRQQVSLRSKWARQQAGLLKWARQQASKQASKQAIPREQYS